MIKKQTHCHTRYGLFNMDAVFVNIILSENQRLPVNYMYSCFAAVVGSYLLEIFSIKVAHRRSKM